MNHRLTAAAALAVILASTSEWVLISGGNWLIASIGAVITVALAGTVTRLAPTQAAIGATAFAVLASMPLLFDKSLLLKLAGLVIIGCCAASATRVRAFRPIADLVTYLAALLLYLNLTLSNARSFALLIPTANSLHHLSTLASAGTAVAKDSPPVPGAPGVILLASAGIGLAAIVVDIIAVRMRKPAIAGLPLLVIYMAPIATAAKSGGPSSILTFVFAGSGYLALLASDGRHRLRGWGRIVTVWHYADEDERLGGADIRGLAATGRRIGFAALCAAVVAPLLLPSLNLHRLFDGHGGGDRVVSAGLPNPVDEMQALLTESNPTPVLSYQTNSVDGEYLQVYVVNYNSSKGDWEIVKPGPTITIGQKALLAPPGVASSTQYTQAYTTIKLDNVVGSSAGYNFSVFFLPVPYWPVQIGVDGTWSEAYNTLMVFSGSPHHSGLQYQVTSDQPVLSPSIENSTQPIPASIRQSYLGFNSPVTPQLSAIARFVTKGAKNQFQKAVDLEKYFQSGQFKYTLHPPKLPDTADGLLDFLTKTKQGFCEQFAFAMAALARLVGIPSRIAIGYTGGTKHAANAWQVTTADAHSWPELWFPQVGWLRFEPTPGGPNGQGSASQPSYALPAGRSGDTGPNLVPPITSKTGKITGAEQNGGAHVKAPPPDQVGTDRPISPKAPAGHAPIGQILLALLALLLVAAAVPGTTRVVGRRRRWRAAVGDSGLASAAWQEVCADLDDFGLTRRLSESPRATARRISVDANIDETARQAIGRIATVVERCRYAPVPASADGIRADVIEVRRSLARNAGVLQRLRARLAPTSVIAPMIGSFRQTVGQRTGWLPTPT